MILMAPSTAPCPSHFGRVGLLCWAVVLGCRAESPSLETIVNASLRTRTHQLSYWSCSRCQVHDKPGYEYNTNQSPQG